MSAHPAYVPTKTYFYAMGNTPAVDLLDYIPPEDDGRVLLLGCGDPRSILHTVSDRLTSSDRQLDITCCDWEPGVIARNIILLTLVAESDLGSEDIITRLWSVFYHFFLDRASLDLIVKQSNKLADASHDLATWKSSPYSRFIKMCSAHTCSELNKYWMKYVEIGSRPANAQATAKEKFAKEMKKERRFETVDTAIRTAGPWFIDMLKTGGEHFKMFWDTGVTTIGTSTDAFYVNPTFAFTLAGEQFVVHYGTDPIFGFHLAPALAPVEGREKTADDVQISDLDMCALDEFRRWCSTFRSAINIEPLPKVVVRFFTGEALAFCYALQAKNLGIHLWTAPFVSPWTAKRITLNPDDYNVVGTAPTRFNVIESSNITDHLGLLNVLPATIPLLEESPSSVLCTNTLLPSGATARGSLEYRLCGDVAVMALLLGLAPTTYSSGFSPISKVHEVLYSNAASNNFQSPETFIWKFTSDGEATKPSFDPLQLARFLHGVYLKMFASESISHLQGTQDVRQLTTELTLKHYTRLSFVILLRMVRDRVSTNWDFMLDRLFGLIENDDNLILGTNFLQDLYGWLHLTGVHTVDTLLPNQTSVQPKDIRGGRFNGWKDIPGMVCVLLVVPRHRLKILTDMPPEELGTPIFQADLRLPYAHNIFACIQICYGTCRAVDNDGEPQVEIQEDPLGLKGKSPMIVSLWMPTWILRQEPNNIKIGLSLHPSPNLVQKLMPKLGAYLSIFDAKVTDKEHVHISRERPGFRDELTLLSQIPASVKGLVNAKPDSQLQVELDGSCARITLLKSRIDIAGPEAKELLTKGVEVTFEQITHSMIVVSFGDFKYRVNFDVPIDGKSTKLRIARKSSYIEVHAPIIHDGNLGQRFFVPAPILTKSAPPVLRHIHYLDLERQPILDTKSDPERLRGLVLNMAGSFSERERNMRENTPQEQRDIVCNVKDTISTILLVSSGIDDVKSRVFGLEMPPDIGIYTLIFVEDIRLDLVSNTIVADAYILPLTREILSEILNDLRSISGDTLLITTLKDEMLAWKRLLPAFTERCRKWRHIPTCEYAKGQIPVSTETEKSPICSCGKGKDLGMFATRNKWGRFAPYVTRAAISQLFAVSFLEEIGLPLGADMNPQGGAGEPRCAACGGPGKPKLLLCGRCKKISYCSASCQKMAWKKHKVACKA